MKYAKDELMAKIEVSAQDIMNTYSDYDKLISYAKENKPVAVGVMPFAVKYFAQALKDTGVKVDVQSGSPAGSDRITQVKLGLELYARDGAEEFDFGMNMQLLPSDEYDLIVENLKDVFAVADPEKVRVVVETNLVDEAHVAEGTKLIAKAGGKWVNCGITVYGAPDLEKIKVVMDNAEGLKVKVNGVNTPEMAAKLLEMGVDRISVPIEYIDDVMVLAE